MFEFEIRKNSMSKYTFTIREYSKKTLELPAIVEVFAINPINAAMKLDIILGDHKLMGEYNCKIER